MNRLRSEEGFTLPEVLTTLVIAMIVSLATFALVEVVMKRSGEISARVDTTQRSRTAMDQITRQLRSQVCALRSDQAMSAARSIDAASPTSVTVFADFTNEALVSGVVPAPDMRTITFADGTLTEVVTKGKWSQTDNRRVNYSYASPVVNTRPFLTGVAPLSWADTAKTKPVIFRYFKFNTTGSPPLPDVEIAKDEDRALTPEELESVARITVGYRVLPGNGKLSGSTRLENDIYVRTADPNAPTPKPTCLTF